MAGHLTFEERRLLYRLRKQGKSPPEIAELMGRHRSTIYRELDRNAGQRGYRPQQAQRLADERRLASRRPPKMNDPDVQRYVQERLEKFWSPEQIAGRVERDFPRAPGRWLSRQTIYDWIDDRQPEWQGLLRRQGRPPETRGKLVDCVRIAGRPDVINRRRRYGDWEGDTMVGKRRRSAAAHHGRAEERLRPDRPGRRHELGSDDAGGKAAARRPSAVAPAKHDLRQRQGVCEAFPIDRAPGAGGLLRRPVRLLAARGQRKYERAAAAVLSQRHGLHADQSPRGGSRGTITQRTSSQTARLSNPGGNLPTEILSQLILAFTG